MRQLIAILALSFTIGCTGLQTKLGSPEALIAKGADGNTAAIVLATALLNHDRINVTQAKSYKVILDAASDVLHTANDTLEACRTETGSTRFSKPDPCAIGVADVIGLALSNIHGVQKTLEAK